VHSFQIMHKICQSQASRQIQVIIKIISIFQPKAEVFSRAYMLLGTIIICMEVRILPYQAFTSVFLQDNKQPDSQPQQVSSLEWHQSKSSRI